MNSNNSPEIIVFGCQSILKVESLYPIYELYGTEIARYLGDFISERMWAGEAADGEEGFKTFGCKVLESGDILYIVDVEGFDDEVSDPESAAIQLTLHINQTEDIFKTTNISLFFIKDAPMSSRANNLRWHLQDKLEVPVYDLEYRQPPFTSEWETVKKYIAQLSGERPSSILE